jgi:hypothetical protein
VWDTGHNGKKRKIGELIPHQYIEKYSCLTTIATKGHFSDSINPDAVVWYKGKK